MKRSYCEIRKLIDDQFGNHVVQKIVEKGQIDEISDKLDAGCEKSNDLFKHMMSSMSNFIVGVKNKIYDLSTNSLGCRVVQKLIECIPTAYIKDIVYPEIMLNISNLAEDKQGNYVIQHILTYSDHNYKAQTINIVSKNIYNLSCQKFSSNVVQECFKMSSGAARCQLLDAILDLDGKKVIDLMKHM